MLFPSLITELALYRTYSGPTKSKPVWVNGGSSDTQTAGKSGGLIEAYGNPENLQHITQFCNTFFMVYLPFKIQMFPKCGQCAIHSTMFQFVMNIQDQ